MRTSTDRLTRRQWLKKGALLVPAGFVFPRILTRAATVTVIQPTRYTAYAATFDGTNDYLSKASPGLSGIADGTSVAFSLWCSTTQDGFIRTLGGVWSGASTTLRFRVIRDSTNKMRVYGATSGGTLILDASGSTDVVAASGWVHVFFSCDLTNSSNRLMYVNGVAETVTWGTYTNDSIEFTNVTTVGATGSGTLKWNGCISEVWMDTQYLDSSYVTKFYNGGTQPNLGSDGSGPTGSQPLLYLRNPYDSFETNSGSGGNFTVTGALSGCTGPS